MAVTVGAGRAWTVNGCVDVLVQRHDESTVRVANVGKIVGPDAAAEAADTIGYGVVAVRAWPAILGFGTFGVQTAHGNSPTKRSPTGLASGCCCDVIFNAALFVGAQNSTTQYCSSKQNGAGADGFQQCVVLTTLFVLFCICHCSPIFNWFLALSKSFSSVFQQNYVAVLKSKREFCLVTSNTSIIIGRACPEFRRSPRDAHPIDPVERAIVWFIHTHILFTAAHDAHLIHTRIWAFYFRYLSICSAEHYYDNHCQTSKHLRTVACAN